MLFNSSVFAIFLCIVFCLYWFVFKQIKQQNILLLLASLFFYGWWDWRFLSLICFSSVLDFAIGLALQNTQIQSKRKWLLITSIVVNIGLLFTFKYYNFFVESFIYVFHTFGINLNIQTLSIILPLGISFYTFQTLSYTIDVYKRVFEPTKDIIAFMAYISFFPQLVAGPIERASNLLPQFFRKRTFDKTFALEGLKIMLWGFFKKIVIADGISVLIDPIFKSPEYYSGGTLAIAGVLFAVQIYADFSGYSEIAIGTARLFGFRLMKNFNYPYFASSIIDFWKRWHISLTSWFKDYIYIPLGGNRHGLRKQIINTCIIFIVSGIWHGANFTFILWGVAHAIFFIPGILFRKKIYAIPAYANSILIIGKILYTNCIVILLWFLFRAQSIEDVVIIFSKIFSADIFELNTTFPFHIFVLVCILMITEWFGRRNDYAIVGIAGNAPRMVRWSIYYGIMITILYYFETPLNYIYFQF